MRLIHYLYIAPLALLAACSDGNEMAAPAADHPNGAIQLSAGIVEGGSAVTRAGGERENATHDGVHQTFTNGTALALQVSGKWKKAADGEAEVVTKNSTGVIGNETTSPTNHNKVTFTGNNILYWDDFGTADSYNTTVGRTEGLTIYGAAVNGETAKAPSVSNYEALNWTLDANQSSGFSANDLLISNNVKGTKTEGKELDTGTYKFDERSYGKLLIFTHAMSKITVNLKADEGFGGSFTSTEVKLVGAEGANPADNASWAYTEGTVNITTGEVTKKESTQKVITMAQAATASTGYTVTKEALVMPQSEFSEDDAIIARVNADGNIYYVKAKEIRDKINAMGLKTDEQYLMKPGYNYIINVVVKKTKIEVTATVTNWSDVESEQVTPEINVIANWGDTPSGASTLSKTGFSFYRSTSLNDGYSTVSGTSPNEYYAEESVVSYASSEWGMTPQLYWPNHSTHYQFRGVWPRTKSATNETNAPVVQVSDGTTNYQVIKVTNVAYDDETFPSDLMIARPEFTKNGEGYPKCNNSDHTSEDLYNVGICATEGKINLNFQYMMSQVEVKLTTSDEGATDRVNLTDAKVEIVGAYISGNVKLGDRGILFLAENTKPDYTMNKVGDDATHYRDAIVPQYLEGVKFKITADGDVYYADVKEIKEYGSSNLVAPNGKWENGVHYVYNLTVTKTKVNVTAKITEWDTVTASENVWF